MALPETDLYVCLEVSREASQKEIKTAYRRQVLKYHPDRNGSAERLMEVIEAYEILSDPKKKAGI